MGQTKIRAALYDGVPENPWVYMWELVVLRALDESKLFHPKLRRDAIEWLTCGETEERTFIWCCRQAGMDPDSVLKANGLYTKEDVARRLPTAAHWRRFWRGQRATGKLRRMKKKVDNEKIRCNSEGQKEGI